MLLSVIAERTCDLASTSCMLQRMATMGVNFIEGTGDDKDFSSVESGDVAILPAFGASVQEMRTLADRGVQIIDTTCPWVSKVWNAVDKQVRPPLWLSCSSSVAGGGCKAAQPQRGAGSMVAAPFQAA